MSRARPKKRRYGLYLRTALKRLPSRHRFKTYRSPPPFLVVSPGGVATTALMEFCARFVPINSPHDSDWLKHIPNLPRSLPPGTKILFVYGETDAIYRSVLRRDFVAHQGAKLGSVLCAVTRGELQRRIFAHAVERQRKFFETHSGHEVMCIHYDGLWDRVAEIAAFLEITDPSFLSEFPERRSRLSAAGDGAQDGAG